MTVYLIHFHRPYKHARHYMGYTDDLPGRLKRHRAGNGSRLMTVIKDAGIRWSLARTWPGDRKTERSLKALKNSPRLCPICRTPALYTGHAPALPAAPIHTTNNISPEPVSHPSDFLI